MNKKGGTHRCYVGLKEYKTQHNYLFTHVYTFYVHNLQFVICFGIVEGMKEISFVLLLKRLVNTVVCIKRTSLAIVVGVSYLKYPVLHPGT